MTFPSGKRSPRRRKRVITLRRAGFFLPTERPGKASLYPLLYRVAALVRRKGQQGENDSRRRDGERASNRKNRQIEQHAVLLLNAQTLVHERQAAARTSASIRRRVCSSTVCPSFGRQNCFGTPSVTPARRVPLPPARTNTHDLFFMTTADCSRRAIAVCYGTSKE